MAINQRIKQQIDDEINQNMVVADFTSSVSSIIRQIFDLIMGNRATPEEAVDTSSYLIYRISYNLMRSANYDLQQRYGLATTNLLRWFYNNQALAISLGLAANVRNNRRPLLRILINFYNFHYAFLSNGVQGTNGSPAVLSDARDTLEQGLRSFVGVGQVALRQLPAPVAGYQHIRLNENFNQGDVVEVGGSFSRTGNARNVSVATWNLQGQSPEETKWINAILPLARGADFVFIQEAGSSLPRSFTVQQIITVRDQFGFDRDVGLYLWNAGTATRPLLFDVYFYNVGRARVNLAIVTPHVPTPMPIPRPPLIVREPVIISDLSSAGDYRPLFGLRIEGSNPVDRLGDIVIYNFHAISGGGPNAPRMVREAVWHTDVPHIIGGDFNRDPRPSGGGTNPGPWVSPQDYAQIAEASGPTHPAINPNAMLDYFVTNGTMARPLPGTVQPPSLSDHRAVVFDFSLPFG